MLFTHSWSERTHTSPKFRILNAGRCEVRCIEHWWPPSLASKKMCPNQKTAPGALNSTVSIRCYFVVFAKNWTHQTHRDAWSRCLRRFEEATPMQKESTTPSKFYQNFGANLGVCSLACIDSCFHHLYSQEAISLTHSKSKKKRKGKSMFQDSNQRREMTSHSRPRPPRHSFSSSKHHSRTAELRRCRTKPLPFVYNVSNIFGL
jgi:hypothetical protein